MVRLVGETGRVERALVFILGSQGEAVVGSVVDAAAGSEGEVGGIADLKGVMNLSRADGELGVGLKLVKLRKEITRPGNSHLDAAWLWPWTETVDVVKRTFGSALQLLRCGG